MSLFQKTQFALIHCVLLRLFPFEVLIFEQRTIFSTPECRFPKKRRNLSVDRILNDISLKKGVWDSKLNGIRRERIVFSSGCLR